MSVEMETLVVELIAKCYFGRGAQEAIAAGADDGANTSVNKLVGIKMNFAVRKRRAPSIIIVSLVDILTILLIFFVVSTTFKKTSRRCRSIYRNRKQRRKRRPSWSTPSSR